MDIFFGIVFGMAILLAGGQVVVYGSVRAARSLGVSEFLIGVVLIGFGTSAPELITSVKAALSGSPGIAFGNVVGSNIANILLILGATVLMYPITVDRRIASRDGPILLGLTALFVLVSLWLPLSRPVALLYVAGLILYVYLMHKNERVGVVGDDQKLLPKDNLMLNVAIAPSGVGGLVVGAGMLVDSSVELAEMIGISETVIGLTIVAIGTSLPELTASVLAAKKGKPELALGNVIGSNIYNMFGILGITGLLAPSAIPSDIIYLHNPIMLLITLALAFIMWRHTMISSRMGRWFVGLYVGYLLILMITQ